MTKMAEAKGATVAQIALAWLLHQKVVRSVIIGAKRVEQLDDNIAATQVKLNEDDSPHSMKSVSLPANIRAGCSRARASTGRINCGIERRLVA